MAILAKLMDFYLAAGKTTILPVCLTKRGNAPCKQTKLAFEMDGQNTYVLFKKNYNLLLEKVIYFS